MEKIALGMVGRAWAILFARAGREVAIYDSHPGAVVQPQSLISDGTPPGILAELSWKFEVGPYQNSTSRIHGD